MERLRERAAHVVNQGNVLAPVGVHVLATAGPDRRRDRADLDPNPAKDGQDRDVEVDPGTKSADPEVDRDLNLAKVKRVRRVRSPAKIEI